MLAHYKQRMVHALPMHSAVTNTILQMQLSVKRWFQPLNDILEIFLNQYHFKISNQILYKTQYQIQSFEKPTPTQTVLLKQV